MRAKGSGQSVLLLLDVIHVLNALHVPYAIVGAFAASFYGVVRASMDADAVISLHASPVSVSALQEKLHGAGVKSAYRKGDIGDPVGGVIAVEDRFHNKVDLLLNIQGMTEAIFSRTIEAGFMNTRVRVVGLEDFIAMKLFAGGPKDVQDAIGVLGVSSQRVRLPLLKQLARSYGKETVQRLHSVWRKRSSQ